jgi:hypothetical protein
VDTFAERSTVLRRSESQTPRQAYSEESSKRHRSVILCCCTSQQKQIEDFVTFSPFFPQSQAEQHNAEEELKSYVVPELNVLSYKIVIYLAPLTWDWKKYSRLRTSPMIVLMCSRCPSPAALSLLKNITSAPWVFLSNTIWYCLDAVLTTLCGS